MSYLEELEVDYFEYLKDEAFSGRKRKKLEEDLLEFLYEIPFYYDVRNFPRDENRKMDGQRLRENYLIDEMDIPLRSEIGVKFLEKEGGCSVLEMLLALSFRADLEYTGDGSREGKSDLFWIMLDNLDLLHYPYGRFQARKASENVTKWLDRDIDSAGNGGIFPLKRWHKNPEKRLILAEVDQRKREIWDQMMSFLSETVF